jgi:hypothetical protein
MTTKAKIKKRERVRDTRWGKMNLSSQYLIRILEGLPTKRIEKELLRRKAEKGRVKPKEYHRK